MKWKSPLAAIMLVLVMVAIPLAPADEVDPTRLEWWGTTTIGKGFHIRVPVTVTNSYDVPIENGAVMAEIDIAEKLIESGWVSTVRAGDDLLRSFELDEASIRVVAMTDLEPMTDTSIHGRLAAYNKDIKEKNDPARYEVPSTYIKGSLTDPKASTFHPRTNPTVTVVWRVEDMLQPDHERHYVVYFDSTTNNEHEAPDYGGVRPGGGLLERTFWSGPGVDLLGIVQPQGSPGVVSVIGLHDETSVEVLTGTSSGSFSHQQPPTGAHENPFIIQEGEVREIFISLTYGTPFRLVASKPIMALVDSEGFVPTTSGSMLAAPGDAFLFRTTYDAQAAQDSLFFVNHDPSDPPAPTVLELTNLDDGATQEVHLSDATNQLPYTVGVPAAPPQQQDGSCVFPDRAEAVRVPPGRNPYSARVVSGGPVSLQFQPIEAATQLPASDASPVGMSFWTTLSRSTASANGGTCLRNTAQYGLYATAPSLAELSVYNPESTAARVFPHCTSQPCEQGYPLGGVPDATIDGETLDTGDIFDRPLRLETTKPTWLMVDPEPTASLRDARLRGPLGGADAGRGFAGFGATSVYAPYPNTVIQADIAYAASGVVEQEVRIVQGRLTPLPERPGDPILWYTLEADRPIVVLPAGAEPGFLAGVPPTLEATVHPADFRGYLVEVESTTGLNPVSRSAVPGEPVEYTFTVTNHGRDAGNGNLPDTIGLDVGEPPEGWTAELNRYTVGLDSNESATVRLTVTPGTDAVPGDLGPISIRATSQRNGLVTDSADSVTHIKRTAGVSLWFECARTGCPKQSQLPTTAGEAVEHTIFVQNTGTVADTIQFEVSPPEGEWDVLLLHGGAEATALRLEADEVAELSLRVTAPAADQGRLGTVITAKSQASFAIRDVIYAETFLQAPSDLVLEAGDPVRWVMPDEEAVFLLELRNDGKGNTQLFFDLSFDELPDWTQPSLYMPTPGGQRLPIPAEGLNIDAGQRLPVAINVTPGPDAAAGQRHVLRLHVGTPDPAEGQEVFLYTIVEARHDLDVEEPLLPLHVPRGGQEVPVEFILTNHGNLNETLHPVAASLPPAWNITFPADQILIPKEGSQAMQLGIHAPQGVAEGAYTVAVDLVAEDGNTTRLDIPIRVGSFLEHAVQGPGIVEGQPGRTAWSKHTIRNHGNTPLSVGVTTTPGETWVLAGDEARTIAPGAEAEMRIGWSVPADVVDGVSTHQATLELRPESPDVESVEAEVRVDIDVGRPELRVVDAKAFPGAAGRVIQASIANDGTRTAYGVDVELHVDEQAVDRVVLAEVPPGSVRNATLLQPEAKAGEAVVRVNAAGAMREAEPTDNAKAVDEAASKETAALHWLMPAGILAALSLGQRRRLNPETTRRKTTHNQPHDTGLLSPCRARQGPGSDRMSSGCESRRGHS